MWGKRRRSRGEGEGNGRAAQGHCLSVEGAARAATARTTYLSSSRRQTRNDALRENKGAEGLYIADVSTSRHVSEAPDGRLATKGRGGDGERERACAERIGEECGRGQRLLGLFLWERSPLSFVSMHMHRMGLKGYY